MNLRNRVQLIGNLGSEPVIRDFGNNKKMARFSVATQDIYKKDGKFVKDVQWHSVVAWDKIAETAEKNMGKGTEVVIDGRLIRRSYNDKNGDKQYISEIIAEALLFRNKNIAVQTELEFENKRA